jgi:hypothetical protein
MAQRIRIGELLVKAGVLDDLQLRSALNEQRKWGGPLGKVLVDLGYVDEPTMVRALSKQLGLRRAQLERSSVPHELLAKLDPSRAREKRFCPERFEPARKTLVVAMADPTDVVVIDDLAFRTGCRVEATIAGESEISKAIDLIFFGRAQTALDLDVSFESMRGTDHGPFSEIDPRQLEGPPPPSSGPPADAARSGGAPSRSGERFGPIERPSATPSSPPSEIPSPPPMWGEPSTAGSEDGAAAKLEAAQKRQNRAIRVMLDMLIERGVFTEDEFRARLAATRGKTKG